MLVYFQKRMPECSVFIQAAQGEDKTERQKENLQVHSETPHLTRALPVSLASRSHPYGPVN